MTQRRLLLSVVLALLILFAGCTSLSTSDGGAPSEPTATATPTATQEGMLEVHFINVGQSDAILVVGKNETLLMDTGDFRDNGEVVLDYLQRQDIQRLDYLVSSHADADHIGGHAAVIEYFETQAEGVGAVYDPGIAASTQTYERYLDAVEQYNVTLYAAGTGDSIPFTGAAVDILGPPRPYLENRDRNENSIVLKLQHGQTSVLLPGDAEDDQEADLVERYGDSLNATVLRAAHHGSASSSTKAFLDAVSPKTVVITSAYDSQYGHPDDVVLDRLAGRQIPTYWSATHGNIVLTSNATAVTVSTQAQAPTDPTRLREGDPVEPGTLGSVTLRATIQGGAVKTPIATDGGTTTATPAEASLVIEAVHADASGDDQDNLNDEYITLANEGARSLDLSGWTISDAAGKEYLVPQGVTLESGASLTLHTGSGENTDTDLYWDAGSPVWNNGGDTITITNSEGRQVLQEEYE